MTRTLLLLLVLCSLLPACGRYGPPVRRDRPTREAAPVRAPVPAPAAAPAAAPEPAAETRPDVPPGPADDAAATGAGDADREDEEEAQ